MRSNLPRASRMRPRTPSGIFAGVLCQDAGRQLTVRCCQSFRRISSTISRASAPQAMSSVRSAAPEGHAPTAFASTAMASLIPTFAGAQGGALLVVPTLHEPRAGLHSHRRVAAIGAGADPLGEGLVPRRDADQHHVVVAAAALLP